MKLSINYCHRLCIILFAAGCLSACSYSPSEEEPRAEVHSPFLDFYQGPLNHLSAVRRGTCPSYPSCSEYSRQAIAKHGPIIGAMLTTDRLMRCGRDETKTAPRIYFKGRWLYYDPLENNDFWLSLD
jgi:putative component of membrane protein insertase Oxa1/YidC/SpoIIIJ protein YidD